MTSEQREHWTQLLSAAQSALAQGSSILEVPPELLLRVDLELSALQALYSFRHPAPPLTSNVFRPSSIAKPDLLENRLPITRDNAN